MYKVGTGLGGTVAGKVYVNLRTKREGNQNWVYHRGKLYVRREPKDYKNPKEFNTLDTLSVFDPEEFKYEGEISLDIHDFFKGYKDSLAMNDIYIDCVPVSETTATVTSTDVSSSTKANCSHP